MAPNGATVLIVDDDVIVRRSVSRLVRAAGFEARTFSSPRRFLRCDLPNGPACVVLDMCMDELSGLDVQDALRQRSRGVPIVFLSGHGTIPTATTTIKHGAEEFLEKPVRPKALIDAVRRAVERDRVQSADRLGREELQNRYNTLTAREQQVMALVVTGLLNKQSAYELGISEKTIKVHRARVMEKMQVESLAALVHLAGKIGIPAPVTAPAPAT